MSTLPFTYASLAPVVLDLDGDGVTLTSVVASTVRFDMDGDGVRDRTGWAGAKDGLLVYDANGNGLADNGAEIAFQSYVSGAPSDLAGLQFFDTNGNGKLDAADTKWSSFRVWKDANQDGTSDAGELTALSNAGIAAISLNGTPTGRTPNGQDNTLFATSTFTRSDGSSGSVGDVFLAFAPGSDDGSGASSPITNTSSSPASPGLVIATHDFARKAKKFQIDAKDGSLYVNFRHSSDLIDPRAGQTGPAIIMNFKNRSVGMLSQIVFDLNGDGLNLVRLKKTHTMFDMDGDGRADRTGWVGRSEGILVIDRNGDGNVGGASELTFLSEKPDAKNEFEALATLDTNKDGKLDHSDKRFGDLKVWIDANSNGQTDVGELKTLAELGIIELGLAPRANSKVDKVGENLILATSYFKRSDGTTGSIGEAALAFDPSSAHPLPAVTSPGPMALSEEQLLAMRSTLKAGASNANVDQSVSHSDGDGVIAQMTQAIASFAANIGDGTLPPRDVVQPQYLFHA